MIMDNSARILMSLEAGALTLSSGCPVFAGHHGGPCLPEGDVAGSDQYMGEGTQDPQDDPFTETLGWTGNQRVLFPPSFPMHEELMTLTFVKPEPGLAATCPMERATNGVLPVGGGGEVEGHKPTLGIGEGCCRCCSTSSWRDLLTQPAWACSS